MPAEIKTIFAALFSEPIAAVVDAERETRRIWANWLEDLVKLVPPGLTAPETVEFINRRLKLAPVMRLSATIEAGVTMRVASLKEEHGKASLSLGVGPFQLSGGGGFMSQSSSESVFQARAVYSISNDAERSLKDFLGDLKIPLATPADVTEAARKLKELAG